MSNPDLAIRTQFGKLNSCIYDVTVKINNLKLKKYASKDEQI